jgi:hypothetical protein
MTIRKTLVVSALGALAFLPACGAENPVDSEVAENSEALCANPGGVNAVMTSLAVAAGTETHRWIATRDFQWNSSTGMLELSGYGKARCADKTCKNTQAMLDMQKPAANGKVTFAGNIKLDSNALKSALKAGWDAQVKCEGNGSCPYPIHDLQYASVESGSCDLKYFYKPFKQGTSTPVPDPTVLSNALIFAGYPSNKMLNYYVRDGQVSVDPTAGLNEGGVTTSGSCSAACVRYSVSSVSGQCCTCNGATKTYAVSAFSPYIYMCQ